MALLRTTRNIININNSNMKPLGTWINRLIGRQSSNTNDNKPEAANTTTTEPDTEVTGTDKLLIEKDAIIKEKEKEILELKDKYTRSLAETENTREYMKRQVQDAKLFGIQGFAKDLLNVADILEKAIESSKEEGSTLDTLLSGLQMMETDLYKVFNNHGLKRIQPSLGEQFDPHVHEALFQVSGNKPGTVGVVSKVGYMLNGRTIRPALVGVVKTN